MEEHAPNFPVLNISFQRLGNNFEIEMDKKYVVKSIEAVMIVYYDAIDCPKCGCQNIIWKRLEKVNKFVEKTKK